MSNKALIGNVLEAAFRAYDANGDGALSREETRRLIRDCYGEDRPGFSADQLLDELLAKYDHNRDGLLQREELALMLEEFFLLFKR